VNAHSGPSSVEHPPVVHAPNEPIAHVDQFFAEHSDGCHVLMGDGSVRFAKERVNHLVWIALNTINRGEVFGLLGPNGSGKSTTIKLLLGLIFPDRGGSASVLGRPAGDTSINEKIGFLPEESYLYRFLNGEETLRFYGRLFRMDRRTLNKRVPELLDIVGLDEKARKRKLREYSKGMARRIGLAQALIRARACPPYFIVTISFS